MQNISRAAGRLAPAQLADLKTAVHTGSFHEFLLLFEIGEIHAKSSSKRPSLHFKAFLIFHKNT